MNEWEIHVHAFVHSCVRKTVCVLVCLHTGTLASHGMRLTGGCFERRPHEVELMSCELERRKTYRILSLTIIKYFQNCLFM